MQITPFPAHKIWDSTIGRILNVFGLSHRILKLTPGADPLPANKDLTDRILHFSEFFGSQTTPKLCHGGWIRKQAGLCFSLMPPLGLKLHSTKAHSLDVLIQPLHDFLIGKIKAMFKYVQPHH